MRSEPPLCSRRSVLAAVAGTTTAMGGCAGSDEGPEESTRQPAAGAGRDRLLALAADTYDFFETTRHPQTGLVPDRVDRRGDGREPSPRTSPANVGLQLLAAVGAAELGVVETATAGAHVGDVLETLGALDRWNGLFHRWYRVADGTVDRAFDGAFVSTVDNGLLAAGLVVVRRAFEDHRSRATALLDRMRFEALFDPSVPNPSAPEAGPGPGQFHGGWDPGSGLTDWHYGTFNTEARVASYVAIGLGEVPRTHWWGMRRAPAPGTAVTGSLDGRYRRYDGIRVWEGTIRYADATFVPSWGGSAFESLLPAIVLPEPRLAEDGLGGNCRRHAALHVGHADGPAWGFSPCATPDGYDEFGVAATGIEGYDRDEWVTPHATLLAADFVAPGSLTPALDAFEDWGLRTEYGYYDSVRPADGTPTESWLALDQGMALAALANALTDGSLRSHFLADPVGRDPSDLLERERFHWDHDRE